MSYEHFFLPPVTPSKTTYGPDLAVRLICPDCRTPVPRIVEEYSSGDLVCGDCGLVLGDRIVDTRNEWRAFDGDTDPSRVGEARDPLLDEGEQLCTTIGSRDGKSGVARELQLAAAHVSKRDSRLQATFHAISDMCDAIGLPLAVKTATKLLYKRVHEQRLLRAQSSDAVVAACIFIACRADAQTRRTFHDICLSTRVPTKVIARCFRTIEHAFRLQGARDVNVNASANGSLASGGIVAGARPEDMLVRYCSHLALRPHVAGYAAALVVRARELGIAGGRNPKSVAGAAILFATGLLGEQTNLKDIASVVGVQERPIKIVYRMLHADREKLVKQEWLDSGRASLDRLVSGEISQARAHSAASLKVA